MVVAIELVQKVIDPMIARKFGRIVNITSGSVKMPLVGLDLSSGARAGLTAFLAGVARSVAPSNVTINFVLPGTFDTDRFRANVEATAKKKNISYDACVYRKLKHARSVCWVARESGGLKSLQRSDEGRCIQRQG
jgi:3-oxoacyl-[acyl-carrier protein] reductase